jgi:hypothetical protein
VTLPALLSWESVQERLQVIFPDGTKNRGYVTRDLAASTVFVALYIGAVEGRGVFLAPKHVYRMSDEQADLLDPSDRMRYCEAVMKPGGRAPGQQWYADTSREPIRDETLREGLVSLGAAIEKADVPTTSSKPRYALKAEFAALFDPSLSGEVLVDAISAWQAKSLTKGALARIAIVRRGGVAGGEHVPVTLPNGQKLHMKPGPSSEIAKAVIEVFAATFLKEPAVLFVSESGNKILAHHDEMARSIGLAIKAEKNLPDAILVDLGPEHPLLVFVEVVATDGPINDRRKQALEDLAKDAGFPPEHIAYVTAYSDRSASPFKKTVDSLAWGSYAWFASEPEGLIELSVGRGPLR